MRSTIAVLCTDAFFTVLTWLPFTIFQLISTDFILHTDAELFQQKTNKIITMYRIQGFLTCLLLINCFSSPVIYFGFNQAFRVSSYIYIVRYRRAIPGYACECTCVNECIVTDFIIASHQNFGSMWYLFWLLNGNPAHKRSNFLKQLSYMYYI